MTPATLIDPEAPTAPDPADQLSHLTDEIARLDARRLELVDQRVQSMAELSSLKSTLGYMVANGSSEAAIANTQRRVTEAQARVDGIVAAVASIEQTLRAKQRAHADAAVDLAATTLSSAKRRQSDAMRALDTRLRAFVRDELADLAAELRGAVNTTELHWHELQAARRAAGMPVDGPSAPPSDRLWTACPDLRGTVEQLEKYAGGLTPIQSLHNANMRNAQQQRRHLA